MKKQYIPEVARDKIRACIGSEDSMKFRTCEEVSALWAELGQGIIKEKGKDEGWKEGEAEGKAHRWFLSSLAADAGLGYQSMLNRQRVGDNIIARGYYGGENESVSYQKFVSLMVNAEKDENGLVLKSVLDERLEWFHNVADDNQGQPPSVLDIQNQFRKNGEKEEWEIIWGVVYRNCKRILDLTEVPTSKYKLAREIVEVEPNLSGANVVSTGGSFMELKKPVDGADTIPRKYEVPTIIYKDDGYTGALSKERRYND